MTGTTIHQLEQTLVDQFFANLNQQAAAEPPQIEAPQAEQPRPYYRKPQASMAREQIEVQLHQLIDASTTRLYELLQQRFADVVQGQQAIIESQRKQLVEAQSELDKQRTASGMCTPSRGSIY